MKQVFAVKDTAVQAFGLPFYVRAKGEALRSFQDEVNRTDGKSEIAAHPDDYELYHLGEYEETTGVFLLLERPEIVTRAKDLLTPRE